jgi:hypothetical protein
VLQDRVNVQQAVHASIQWEGATVMMREENVIAKNDFSTNVITMIPTIISTMSQPILNKINSQ